MELDGIAEALRAAHCDRQGQDHKCLGTVFFGPEGITLDCKLCGRCDPEGPPSEKGIHAKAIKVARAVLEAVGFNWDALSAEQQWAAMRSAERHY